jgi:hypothetical protein
MRNVILSLILAIMSNSAFAKWEISSTSKDGLKTHYIDRDSIQKKYDYVQMSTLLDFEVGQRVEESPSPMFYKSVEKQFDYDCKNMQYRMTSYSYYSDQMGHGNIVIGNVRLSEPNWKKVVPGSTEAELWNIACDKK